MAANPLYTLIILGNQGFWANVLLARTKSVNLSGISGTAPAKKKGRAAGFFKNLVWVEQVNRNPMERPNMASASDYDAV